jgi:V8-like Glu-specific endopeptidase
VSTESNRTSRRLNGLALGAMVALVAAATLVPSVASGAQGQNARKVAVQRVGAQQQQQAKAYWTRARLEAARPYPLPKVRATGGPVGGLSTQPTGRPHSVEGRLPKGAQQAAATAAAPQGGARAVAAVEPALYSYPFPFTRYFVETQLYNAPATPGVYPYISVGKIFFTQNGSNYVCSGASVVSAAAFQTVWTAGHCLSDGSNTFNTNTVFVPSFRNGVAPYGLFTATVLVTTNAWHATGDFTRDLGAFRVGVNGAGQTLQSRVGSLGFAWNQPRAQHYNDFGYPAAAPFNGQWMVTCQASHAYDDITIAGAGPDPFAIGCDMTGGSSGGPFIKNFKAQNYINGHNDYKYINPALPLAMFSPYFDALANTVRCVASGNAGPGC